MPTPKQLANLRPAKKGEIRNPEGARTHDQEKKKLKALTGAALTDIVNMILNSGADRLQEIFKDKNETAVRRIAAKLTFRAIRTGNWAAIDPLIIRAVGKPKETIAIEGSNHALLVKMIRDHEEAK